jgi:trans-aconitate 2-methyltransferase
MSTDWSGDDYADVSALQRSMAQLSLSGLSFDGCQRVLDIGCGDGFITRSIARAASPSAVVVGVDPSPLMIATAHRVSASDPSGPQYVIGNALRLPVAGPFDAVVSFNALHWVPQQAQALEQIASVLRGWALIQMVCETPRPSVEDVTQALTGRHRWADRFPDFDAPYCHAEPDHFADLVRDAGLELTSCVVAEREWDFGSREAFTAWCAVGLGAWTDFLEHAERDEFIDDVVTNYQPIAGGPGMFKFAQLRATASLAVPSA